MDQPIALPSSSGNWPATLAAVHARGPRCDHCGGWTFKSFLLTVPAGHRFCDYRCQYASLRAGS